MTTDVKTLGRNDTLTVADDLIKSERIRHLLVLDERGNLEGVVSQRDLFQSALLRALGYGSVARDKVLRSVVVKEVMTEDVETTTPDTPLATAAQVMSKYPPAQPGALVVSRSKRPDVAATRPLGPPYGWLRPSNRSRPGMRSPLARISLLCGGCAVSYQPVEKVWHGFVTRVFTG